VGEGTAPEPVVPAMPGEAPAPASAEAEAPEHVALP